MDPREALSGISIDGSSPVPAYYQVYEALRAQLGTAPDAGRAADPDRALDR